MLERNRVRQNVGERKAVTCLRGERTQQTVTSEHRDLLRQDH